MKEHGKSLKDAANMLKINYSTAKTILRVYRIENRILKKSSNKNMKKCSKCNYSSSETRLEIPSDPDSPPREVQGPLPNKNSQITEGGNSNSYSVNFSLNRGADKNNSILADANFQSKFIHAEINSNMKNIQYHQNNFNYQLPYQIQNHFNTLNPHYDNLYLNKFLLKIQLNMLIIHNCFMEIDHNTTLLTNLNYLFEKMTMKKMF